MKMFRPCFFVLLAVCFLFGWITEALGGTQAREGGMQTQGGSEVTPELKSTPWATGESGGRTAEILKRIPIKKKIKKSWSYK